MLEIVVRHRQGITVVVLVRGSNRIPFNTEVITGEEEPTGVRVTLASIRPVDAVEWRIKAVGLRFYEGSVQRLR